MRVDQDAYSAACEFVKEIKEVDPELYRDVKVKDVLPYFDELAKKIERL